MRYTATKGTPSRAASRLEVPQVVMTASAALSRSKPCSWSRMRIPGSAAAAASCSG